MSENSLLQDFITETGEHLEETERNLLRFEQQPDDVELLNSIFRAVHTIKGSSEYLGLENIAELSHRFEGLLDLLRRGERRVDKGVIDLMIGCNDRIGVLVSEIDRQQEEQSGIDDLMLRLKTACQQTVDESEDIDDEDFGEDEELFGIFADQLKQGIDGLSSDAYQLNSPHADASVLKKSLERLTSLRSSSNYMGYEKLKKVYLKWIQSVEDGIEKLEAGEQVDLTKFVHETMFFNIEQVKTMFPKVVFKSVDRQEEVKEIHQVSESEIGDFEEVSQQGQDRGLLSDFIAETNDHLEDTERNLLYLEQHPGDAETLNKIFRSVHTIKGSSEYLGMEKIAELAHKLESLLDLLRRGERNVNNNVIDLLMACNDRFGVLVDELNQQEVEQSPIEDLAQRLKEATDNAEEDSPDKINGFGEDEYDEELFDIFVEQLTEGINGLSQDVQLLKDGRTDVEILKKSAERLSTLRSSSNYMGYDELKEIYEKWFQDIEQVIASLNTEDAIDLRVFVQETMDVNIAKVKDLFPKVSFEEMQGDEKEGSVQESHADELAAEEKQTGDQELLADFIAETSEHLEETERNLFQLEQNPEDIELLNEIFRSIHTIKGSSEYLGMERIAELAHKLESPLDLMRHGQYPVDNKVIDLLRNCSDRIGSMLKDLSAGKKDQLSVDDLLGQLESKFSDMEISSESSKTVEKLVIEDDTGAVYAEEYDKELFSIFMKQFNSGLLTLTEESDKIINNEDSIPSIERCIECLDKLRSSANYMEYDELFNLYDNWLDNLSGLLENLKDGNQVDVKAFSQDVITENIKKAKSFFSTFKSVAQRPDKTSGISPGDSLDNTIEETIPLSSIVVDDSLKSLSIDDIQEADKTDIEEPVASSDDDNMLLDKLADAFESRLGFSDDVVKQYFNEDIENNLFSENNTDILSGDKVQHVDSESSETNYDLVDIDDVESLLFSSSGDPKKETKLPEPVTAIPAVKAKSLSSSDQIGELRRPRYKMGQRQTDKFRERMIKQSIRVDASKIDALMNQVGELVVSKSGFNQLFSEIRDLQLMLKQSQKLDNKEMQAVKSISNRISEATTSLGRITSELQENVMKVRMLPIAQLFSRYPRLVHDLVRGTEKKVNLEIYGEETELDKKVIEQLTDPLIHIIRNAVDHGIEAIAERRQKGKNETGTIRMEAYPESNYVVIEISDDGKGINTEKIKQRALDKKLISIEEASEITDEELLTFIMRPGFSTAAEVTHTSGRGVGMDVVKDNVEKLNGTIDIDSSIGVGARFQIRIPLTLAIIPALLVRVVNEIFTIPLSTVDETIRIYGNDISTIEGLEVYDLRGNTVPLIRLKSALNMDNGNVDQTEQFVVIVNTGDKQVGFVVDELKGRQEVVIKPLEDYLQERSGFSGATILGDGNISLILDVSEMVQISLDQHASRVKTATS